MAEHSQEQVASSHDQEVSHRKWDNPKFETCNCKVCRRRRTFIRIQKKLNVMDVAFLNDVQDDLWSLENWRDHQIAKNVRELPDKVNAIFEEEEQKRKRFELVVQAIRQLIWPPN